MGGGKGLEWLGFGLGSLPPILESAATATGPDVWAVLVDKVLKFAAVDHGYDIAEGIGAVVVEASGLVGHDVQAFAAPDVAGTQATDDATVGAFGVYLDGLVQSVALGDLLGVAIGAEEEAPALVG